MIVGWSLDWTFFDNDVDGGFSVTDEFCLVLSPVTFGSLLLSPILDGISSSILLIRFACCCCWIAEDASSLSSMDDTSSLLSDSVVRNKSNPF